MRLNQFTIDKDAILLRSEAREKKLSFFLDDDVVAFLDSHSEFVALGETEGKHTKVFQSGLAVNQDIQIPDKLVEREIDSMFFVYANHEAKLHWIG